MKKIFAVLVALFLLAIVACSGGGGGGGEQISKNESKIAVGETSDGTAVVAADIDGNSLINKSDSKALVLMKANSQDNIVIYYGDNNLPVKALIGEYIILYSNWTTNSVDLAIISPDKTYTIKRNLQVDSSIIYSIQNAQKSADFKSSIHSASYKTTSADFLSALNESADIVSVGLCGASIGSAIWSLGVTANLVPAFCSSLIIEGLSALTSSNLDEAETAWDSGPIVPVGGCTGISCIADLFGLGVTAINVAVTTFSSNSGVIDQAQNDLSNTYYYTISGTVSGAVVSDVIMTLDAHFGSYAPVLTDSAGYYIFKFIQNGEYTVTPSKIGYTFSPTSSGIITVKYANVTGMNFTATAPQSVSGIWSRKTDFPESGGSAVLNFSVGSKGYVSNADGSDSPQKFWEYNPSNNSWSQKANTPSGYQIQAPSFVINNTAYMIIGVNVWAYTPNNNQWIQKNNMPGADKRNAFGFSIGNKGYIGGGFFNQNHFYEYNSDTDQWTEKNGIPKFAAYSAPNTYALEDVTFTIANKAYVTGTNESLYEYDSSTDTWIKKLDIDAGFATAFSINYKGYIFNNHGEMLIYDPVSNSHSLGSSFPGTKVKRPAGFSINGKGYIGLGEPENGGESSRAFWEFTP